MYLFDRVREFFAPKPKTTLAEGLAEVRDELRRGEHPDFYMMSASKCIGGILEAKHPHLFKNSRGRRTGFIEHAARSIFFGEGTHGWVRATQAQGAQAIQNWLDGNTQLPWRNVMGEENNFPARLVPYY